MHLEIKNLYIKFPDFVIEDFSLEVEKSEMFVLLGHSGSGKSTLINSIAGFTQIDSGDIYLNSEQSH